MAHFHWQLPQTRKLVRKRKTQTQHRARGSISVRDKLISWNHCLEWFILRSIHWIFRPEMLWLYLFFWHTNQDWDGMNEVNPKRSVLWKDRRLMQYFQTSTTCTFQAFPTAVAEAITSGISGVMVTLKRYMETYIPAIMKISRLWRGLPWVPRPCCRKSVEE